MRVLSVLMLLINPAAGNAAYAPPAKLAPIVARVATKHITPGIEVLLSDRLALLSGKRVALLTNQTGVDRKGVSSVDLLRAQPGVNLVALFSPEHGVRGQAQAGERVASGIDAKTGLPVHSLYGETKMPTKSQNGQAPKRLPTSVL